MQQVFIGKNDINYKDFLVIKSIIITILYFLKSFY